MLARQAVYHLSHTTSPQLYFLTLFPRADLRPQSFYLCLPSSQDYRNKPLCPAEKIHFCCLSCLVCRTLSQQPKLTKIHAINRHRHTVDHRDTVTLLHCYSSRYLSPAGRGTHTQVMKTLVAMQGHCHTSQALSLHRDLGYRDSVTGVEVHADKTQISDAQGQGHTVEKCQDSNSRRITEG
jgi:hypothetical protein